MKFKYNLLTLIIGMLLLYCSKNDSDEPPCLQFYVTISDDCDCDHNNEDCRIIYRISEAEYNRLNDIQNASNNPCLSINSIGRETQGYGGLDFNEEVEIEGYLLLLSFTDCFEWNIF